MPGSARGIAVRAAVAIVALLLGVVCLSVWRVLSGVEKLPYSDGAAPPTSVRVTAGRTYSLAVPGGVRAMLARGVPDSQSSAGTVLDPSCQWTIGNSDTQSLTVSAEADDTKAVNTIGHFEAPVSGLLHISCTNWGTIFVPDSDDRPTDASLWYLLLSVVLLSVGGPLGMAVLHKVSLERRDSSRTSDEDDEVESYPGVLESGDDHPEISSRHRGDLAP